MKDAKMKAVSERTIKSLGLKLGALCLMSLTHLAFAMPLTVQYMNTKNKQSFALLTVNGRKMLFVNVLAASGAKYVGDHYTWWTKGPEGSLTDNTADPNAAPMLAGCKTGT